MAWEETDPTHQTLSQCYSEALPLDMYGTISPTTKIQEAKDPFAGWKFQSSQNNREREATFNFWKSGLQTPFPSTIILNKSQGRQASWSGAEGWEGAQGMKTKATTSLALSQAPPDCSDVLHFPEMRSSPGLRTTSSSFKVSPIPCTIFTVYRENDTFFFLSSGLSRTNEKLTFYLLAYSTTLDHTGCNVYHLLHPQPSKVTIFN
mgnify:CR=1 FL=1